MTRDEAKLLLPVIQAFAEGKDIQVTDPYAEVKDEWSDIKNPVFNPDFAYRIKPESVKSTAYAVVSIGTGSIVALYTDEYDAVSVKNSYRDSANWAVVKLEGTYER